MRIYGSDAILKGPICSHGAIIMYNLFMSGDERSRRRTFLPVTLERSRGKSQKGRDGNSVCVERTR